MTANTNNYIKPIGWENPKKIQKIVKKLLQFDPIIWQNTGIKNKKKNTANDGTILLKLNITNNNNK